MSIIDYEKLCKTTDIRIVKTHQAIFRALIRLLRKKDLSAITITELCKEAMINRKTFYVHYKSIYDVYSDLEDKIIAGFINNLLETQVVTSSSFDPYEYIILTDRLKNENIDEFTVLFPLLNSGTCLRKLGAEMGKLAFRLMAERSDALDKQVYPFTFVFSLCGLITQLF